jgi:DNA-binding NtrC family response regulator
MVTGPVARVPRVLVADDQAPILDALKLLLGDEGFLVDVVRSPEALLAAAEAKEYDAVLMDLNYSRDTTSGREGLDLIPRLVAADPTLPIIVMTAWGSIEGAVEAMRLGARDYVGKPWDDARLVQTLRTQAELAHALRRTQSLETENRQLRGAAGARPDMVATSAAMRPVMKLMERVAPSDANVLITGEHGTGKEMAARWVHAASARASRPLVVVDMGGLAEGVFESRSAISRAASR